MYNSSPRFGREKPTPTPPEVGPYTYVLDDLFQTNRVNVVPFGATSGRTSAGGYVSYTDAIYDASLKENIKGGHTLRNRAKRFISTYSDVPPPGTYHPKLSGKWKQPSYLSPSGKGRIYLCNVTYSTLSSAPSIPTKRDAYGYDVDLNGKILKNIVPSRDMEVGPSSYYIRSPSCLNDSPYRGCHWSRRTSGRSMFNIKQSPGPADYNARKVSSCRRNEMVENYQEMARRFSYLPRYTEQQQILAKSQDYPPPGHYEIPSCFTYKPPVTTVLKPFITRKPRFEKIKQSQNAVDLTDDTKHTMGYKHSPSVKKTSFTFTSRRLKNRIKPSAEPDLYMPKGFTDELCAKNIKPNTLFKPPFDSTVRRDINFVDYDSHLKPDCAMYPREKIPPGYRFQNGHSIFLSKTERDVVKITEAPAVSTYAITECFNRNRNATSHNRKNLPFLELAERKTVILPNKNNPGPADYIVQGGIRNGGFSFDRTQRFNEKKWNAPPPDHYYIHPRYGESIYKAKSSYNLMIAESILKNRLRVPPSDTFGQYLNTLNTKKKLRCYASILDE